MSAAVIRPSFDSNTFSPAGLHILVVDDDSLCLTVLERMLRKCNYRVTACTHAGNALELLRADREIYDLVLSDVYMPDIDGFKLLEIAGLELDLPVIMMSANGDSNVVMKGITHGACDYLIKPVRIEELKNIWQHVVRRRGTDSATPLAAMAFTDSPQVESPHGSTGSASSCMKSSDGSNQSTASRKRKEADSFLKDTTSDDSGQSCNKKARVNWTINLHQQFVNAVNQLGVEKAVPKKLLEIMNVQGLTREHVASHLQKYRLYLKRLNGAVPEPCPIASFQASKDGLPGGTMCILPGAKNSNTTLKVGAASRAGRTTSTGNTTKHSPPQIKASHEVSHNTTPVRTTSDPTSFSGFVNHEKEVPSTPRAVQSSIDLSYFLQDPLDSLLRTSIPTHASGLLQDVACPSRSSSLESSSSQMKWNTNCSVNDPSPKPEAGTNFGTQLHHFKNSNPLPLGYPIANESVPVGFTEANYTNDTGGSARLLDNIDSKYGDYRDRNRGQVTFPQALSNTNSLNMPLQIQTGSSTSSKVSSQFSGLEDLSSSFIMPNVLLEEPDHVSISDYMLQDALFLNRNPGFLAS